MATDAVLEPNEDRPSATDRLHQPEAREVVLPFPTATGAAESDGADWPYQFRYDQWKLGDLCRDRLPPTHERYWMNQMYGQAAVLKRYAGLPINYPLKVAIEHGVVLDNKIGRYDRDAHVPMILTASEKRAQRLRALCKKRVEAIGFGFLYAQQLVWDAEGGKRDLPRHGTIAFPCHSTKTIKARYDHAEYADSLRGLPAELQPVVVCIYWRDYLDGVGKIYTDHGLPLVTAGHMFDDDFLLRFYDLCRQFRYATSNTIGTHLFLTVASGCRFFYQCPSRVIHDVPEDERQDTNAHNSAYLAATLAAKRLFAEPTKEVTRAQKAFVDQWIGKREMKPPGELRRILRRAQLDYVFTPSRVFGDRSAKGWLPYYWRRRWNHLRRAPQKWLAQSHAAAARLSELVRYVHDRDYRPVWHMKRELRRLEKLPIYTETTTPILGRPLKLVDRCSFVPSFEEIFLNRVYEFPSDNPSPLIIDGGANIGLSVLFFKQMYPQSRIIAFEPDPHVFEVLQENVGTFDLENVTLINAALWTEDGTLEFYSEGGDAGRLLVPNDLAAPQTVPTHSLARYLDQPVDLLKLDIEGAEVDVLSSCAQQLAKVTRIFVEYHSFVGQEQRLVELLQILRSAGFRVYVQSQFLSEHPFCQALENRGMDLQLNVFAVQDRFYPYET